MSGGGRLEQNPVYKPIFYVALGFGIVMCLLACFVGKEFWAGLFFLLLFGGLSIPVLISYRTCWIEYDLMGFTRSNFIGKQTYYTWGDVTGLGVFGNQVIIEVHNKKRIHLNETWMNRQLLADAIERHNSQVKKINVPVTAYTSPADFQESYKSGVLNKALVVRREHLAMHRKYKALHYVVCTILALVCVGLFLLRVGPALGVIMVGSTHLLVIIFTIVYYKKPEHFTVREKPSYQWVREVKNHKLFTLPWTYVGGTFANACFYLTIYRFLEEQNNYPIMRIFWLVFFAVMYVVHVLIFRKKSWEYQNYRIGLVSYCFWYAFYIASFLPLVLV